MTSVAYVDFGADRHSRSLRMENQKQGHFSIFRSLLTADWAKDTAKFTLWVRLIGQASHKARKVRFNNVDWDLMPGQLVTKFSVLARVLRDTEGNEKSVQQVRRMLEFFEKEGMISFSGNRFGTVISVKNYADYQADFAGDNSEAKAGGMKSSNGAGLKAIPGGNSESLTGEYEQEGINNTNPPLTPQGGNIEEANKALDYYNRLSKSSCRSAEPFLKLLTPTETRNAYTLKDLCLVVRWALTTWKKKSDSLPKPLNICRVTKFDGYLSDAEKWKAERVDINCQAVIDAYNEVTNGRMPPAELDRDREVAINALVGKLARKNIEGFRNYFNAFMAEARDFYFGGQDGSGWCANFDTLMKPETLRKVKEGAL